MAFTEAFLKKNTIFPFSLGGNEYIIAYNAEFDTMNLFERSVNGRVIDVENIEIDGQTSVGKLTKVPLHNGVFWMIWVHWFPDTKVFS